MSCIDYDSYYIAHISRRELDRLEAHIGQKVNASVVPRSFHQPIVHGAMEYLAQRLCWIFQKMFVFELNQYAASASKQCDVSASEADPVFVAFLQAIVEDELSDAIRSRYSFLFERAGRFCEGFVQFLDEHLHHLGQDRTDLVRLGIEEQAMLEKVEFGQGDPHRGAKATIRYRFSSGEIYYKPRSLALDLLFAAMQRLTDPALPLLESIDRHSYGWQGGIRSGAAEGAAAAEHFYHSLGISTAVAHLLCGSDIHFENIVTDVAGTPFFIDVEALFTNAARVDRQPVPSVAIMAAEHELDRRLGESVFSVGVVSLRRTREGVFSGAAQGERIETPVSREVAVDAKTSVMRLARVRTSVDIHSPVPRVDGRLAMFSDYFDRFSLGYQSAAAALAARASEVRELLDAASTLKSRQILRHTYIYGLFLAESTHPALASPADTERLLLKLRREEASKPFLCRIFDSELQQLLRFDIPYFEAGLDRVDLSSPDGEIEGFFERTALAQTLERLQRFGDKSWVQGQLVYVATLLGCGRGGELDATNVACIAADLLHEASVPGEQDGSVLWTYSPPAGSPGAEFAIAPMGPDLYTGLSGVLTFLLRHQVRYSDAHINELTNRLIDTGCRIVAERNSMLGSGAYSGMEGMLLTLSDAATQRNDDALLNLVTDAFIAREPLWDLSRSDVMDGAAGIALVALALNNRRDDKRLLAIACRLGERLMANAIETADGPEWQLHGTDRCVTGFAHGGSGIAFALARIGEAVSDDRMLRVAERALLREDELFNREIALWPDTREETLQYSLGWCNGAAGFLLARAGCWDLLQPWQRELVADAYHRTTEWFGRLNDDSLCHGTSGVYLALSRVSQQLGFKLALDSSQARSPSDRYRAGWTHDQGNLGLMVGLSGAGLAYLHSSDCSGFCPLTIV